MNKLVSRLMAVSTAILLLPFPGSATCGGGGGGGMGGMRGGGTRPGGNEEVYQVPWKMADPKNAPSAGGMTLYWLPSSADEFKNSSLRYSRSLALYASQCVSM